jgi:hypothetical protein
MVIVEMVHDTLTPGDREIFPIVSENREGTTPAAPAPIGLPGAARTRIRIADPPGRARIEVRVRDPAGLRCRVYAVSAAADFVPAPA